MKNRRLKKFVLPTLYSITFSIIIICLSLISGNISGDPNEPYDYVNSGLITNSWPVFNETVASISHPYNTDSVTIKASYYNKDADETIQQKSLIYYEDTYMPNTGIVYSNSEKFDVIAVLPGTITSIKKDEILGNIITINHGENINTIYYTVEDINVKENQEVTQNYVIGKSGINKIFANEPSIMFEVNINGSIVNPEEFYKMDVNNINLE